MYFEERTYRREGIYRGLVSFEVKYRETDLYIRAVKDLSRKALKSVLKHRTPLEKYIESHPLFLTALEPFEVEPAAPVIVKNMAEAAGVVNVGPMAAVAGAIAELVGNDLLAFSPEVIVENGGDIFLKVTVMRKVAIYAGKASPFTGKLAVEVRPEDTPLGICTSSGIIGHSLSFGRADAVVAVASSTPLADASATAIGNIVKTPEDIEAGIARAKLIKGLKGAVIIAGDKMGVWGDIKLAETR